MKECLEEGILQAYVDNELSPEAAEDVAAHAAACPACAAALDEALNENAVFSGAMEAEMALSVPTARLRQRLDAAIADLNRPARVVEPERSPVGWLASLAGLFKVSPQRALGFASLLAVVAFAAIFAAVQLRRGEEVGNEPTMVAESKGTDGGAKPTTPPAAPSPSSSDQPAGDKPDEAGPKDRQQQRKPKRQPKPVYVPEPDQLPKDEFAAVTNPLPGEENYLKAIDSLMAEIEASGETAMKPSLRAEFERNLAVVNQAIDSTRRTARRNPSDPDAAEFLYSSYQSKLDLLTTVAEQTRPTIATR